MVFELAKPSFVHWPLLGPWSEWTECLRPQFGPLLYGSTDQQLGQLCSELRRPLHDNGNDLSHLRTGASETMVCVDPPLWLAFLRHAVGFRSRLDGRAIDSVHNADQPITHH